LSTRRKSGAGDAPARRPGRSTPPNFLFRAVQTRVLDDLASASRPRVLAIVAPVGYGKTVLMTSLFARLQQQGEHCFWTSLDDRDTTVERVLRLLEDMAYRHGEQLHPTQALFRGDETLDNRVDTLVEAAATYPGSFTAFIDNLDACGDDALGHVLDRLIFDTPPGARFVLSSTAELPLDLARAKLEGQIRQIGYTELSLNRGEVAELLGPELDAAIGSDGIDAVAQQTEGWPAAVRLAQIVLGNAERPKELLARFSGSDEDLAALLNRQVLSGFAPEVRDFLLAIAPLRTFCADLCRYATGSEGAERHLALLLRRNVFVIPVDRNRTWYRLHGLFRQFLRNEAERGYPAARRREVLIRAAEWCERNDDLRDAIDYALAAQAWETASRVLDRSAASLVRDRGDVFQFIAWIEMLHRHRHPPGWEAEYWYVWALVLNRRYDDGRKQIARLAHRLAGARAAATADEEKTKLADLQRRLDIVKICLDIFTDHLADAHAEAARWLESGGADDPFDVTAARLVESVHLSSSFRFAEAREAVQAAQTSAFQTRSIYAQGWIVSLNALPSILEGNYAQIHPELGTALVSLHAALGEGAGICGTVALLDAHCAVEMGLDDDARQLLALGMRSSKAHGFVDAVACGFDAALKLWDGNGATLLAQLRDVAGSYPPRLAFMLSCLIVRRLLRLGRTDAALIEAARIGLGAEMPASPPKPDDVPRTRDLQVATAIDLAVATGRTRSAEPSIADETRRARAEGRIGRLVELALAETAIAAQAGHTAAGNRLLTRAVSLAAPRGIVRPFADQASTIAALVDDTRPSDWGFALAQERRFFADICRRLPISDPSLQEKLVALNMESHLLDPLTRRQIELLGLLDAGLSNQQIADRINVTLTTVKGHLQKLYDKLGVSSRSAAVARARVLKLL